MKMVNGMYDKINEEVGIYFNIIDHMKSKESIELSEVNAEMVKHHLKFYVKRSNTARRYYIYINVIVILLGILIPVFSAVGSPLDIDIWGIGNIKMNNKDLITRLGVLNSFLVSFAVFMSYKLSWQRYRGVAEDMKKIIRQYSEPCYMKNLESDECKRKMRCDFMYELQKIIGGEVNNFMNYINSKKDINGKSTGSQNHKGIDNQNNKVE